MSARAGMPEIDGFIFDMDGTLLHTLPDLAAVTNKALELEGFPPHTDERIRGDDGNPQRTPCSREEAGYHVQQI